MNRFAALRFFYWLALSCSGIAVTWRLWQLTYDAWWLVGAGLAGVALGVLAAPFSGFLADRFDRRQLMFVSLLLAALSEAGLLLAPSPLLLVVAGQVLLLVSSPFNPAFSSMLLHSFSAPDRPRALGRVTSAEAAGMVSGTLLSGFLQIGSITWPFVFAAAALLVAAPLVWLLPSTRLASDPGDRSEPHGFWAGLQVLRAQPVLRLALGAAAFMAVSRQLAVVSEAPLVSLLGGTGSALAWISAAWSVGMVLGGPLAGRLVREGREISALFVARLLVSLGMGAVAFAAAVWQPVLAYFLCGVLWALVPVASGVLVARFSADRVRGRLLALQGAVLQLSQALGMLLSGLAIAGLGARGSFLAAGLVGLLSLPWLLRASLKARSSA